jgi:hypothetical protein
LIALFQETSEIEEIDPARVKSMRFGSIEIPKPLYDAQKAGELVVFAGAGVSIPQPSNYPNFDDLADQIADGTLVREGTSSDREPVDRFLGRLFDRGTKVHEIAKRILSDEKSRSNNLHRHILRLFDGEENVRLVTTNFDNHFAAASREEGKGGRLKIYYAPALPPGENFTGLAHLHGCVIENANTLVLTDGDFGRAYLTEGWARRFLQGVFAQFTVLFVGYSHNDPVMNYLARGLPSGPSARLRYAVTERDKEAHWQYLGILPLTYPMGKHDEVEATLGRWSSQALMGPIDHNARIKSIVEKPVPPAGEELDYIAACLLEPSRTRFFTKHARGLDWLQWMEGQPPFKRLFKVNGNFSGEEEEVSRELAYWFGRKFAFRSQDAALGVVLRKNNLLGPVLWSAISHSVMLESPTAEEVHKWIPVLIETWPLGANGQFLGMILGKYLNHADPSVALLIFGSLLRPRAQLERGFRWISQEEDPQPAVDLVVETTGEWYTLNQAWQQFFSQDIGEFVQFLLPMLTANLQEATLLMRLHGKMFPGFDLITLRMNDSGDLNSGFADSGMGILVRVAKETLDWIIANRSKQAKEVISSWWFADSLALKKLAVLGMAKCTAWKADARLRWILEHQLVFYPGLGEEVAKAICLTFPQANEATRKRLLRTLQKGPKKNANLSEEYYAYWAYSLSLKLKQACPVLEEAAATAAALRKKHPFLPDGDVVRSQPPGLSELQEPVSSLDKAQLLAKDPSNQLSELVSLHQEEGSELRRRALLNQVADAVSEDNDWGMRLAEALRNKSDWKSDLWWAVVEGVNQSFGRTTDRRQLLAILADCAGVLPQITNNIIRFLEQRIAKAEDPVDVGMLELASAVAIGIWPALSAVDDKGMNEAEEWLGVAINHDAGILMQAEISILGKMRKLKEGDWGGIPPGLKAHLSAVLKGGSWASEMARVVLASQTHFFFWLDPTWASDNIFGLFDWEADERRALQAWHGYLFWGRWYNDFIETMMPFYSMTWKRLDRFPSNLSRQFTGHLAGIAVFGKLDPIQTGWLLKFIKEVDPNARAAWASSITVSLKQATPESRQKIWRQWLKAYWQSRLDGSPAPLCAREAGEMVRWSVELEVEFDEVVPLLTRGPDPEPDHRFFYDSFAGSAIPKNHPQNLAVLLAWLLRSERTLPYEASKIREMISVIEMRLTDRKPLLTIRNELVRLGDLPAGA